MKVILFLLHVLLFAFRFIETVIGLPMIIFNLLFTSRIDCLVRFLILRRRKKGGLLRMIQRQHAWDRLQTRESNRKRAETELFYALVTPHLDKQKESICPTTPR